VSLCVCVCVRTRACCTARLYKSLPDPCQKVNYYIKLRSVFSSSLRYNIIINIICTWNMYFHISSSEDRTVAAAWWTTCSNYTSSEPKYNNLVSLYLHIQSEFLSVLVLWFCLMHICSKNFEFFEFLYKLVYHNIFEYLRLFVPL